MELSEVERQGASGSKGEQVVAAWLASGESLEQYSERTGQSVWTLRRWRREHAERFGIAIQRRAGAKRRERAQEQSKMIPVRIVGGEAMTRTAAPMTIEVRLDRQRSIVVPCGIDGATLTRVIAAVEAAR